MKVTIEISEHYARILRSWASYGRHCDQTLRLCREIIKGETITEELEQLSLAVEEDINLLKDPLSDLHYLVREKLVEQGVKPLWNQNQD